ncbi:hypothetical protein Gotur_012404 [Gossypium turneri]
MFDIILPGSQIPEWFSQQRGDSPIKIDLPLEVRNDSQWMGVALCCIFVTDGAPWVVVRCAAVIHGRYTRQANCTQSNFQGRDSRGVDWSGWNINYGLKQPVMKDHILIRYFSRDKLYPISLEDKCSERETNNLWTTDCLDQECHQLELSFENRKSAKVKKCGVRIVYERDLEEMEQVQERHSSQCCANFDDIQQHSADDGPIEWFSQQRGESPIKIDLPLEVRNDSQWMGVALCCIFVSDDASGDEDLYKCGGRETNNLWTTDCLDQECHQLELSFERPDSVKVKKCGVRIVYEKDLEEMEQIKELHSSQCCANFEDIQQHSADDRSIEKLTVLPIPSAQLTPFGTSSQILDKALQRN